MNALSFFTRCGGGAVATRAVQISEYLGAKLNPKSDYENDVCIYIKFNPEHGGYHKKIPKKAYVDIVDGDYMHIDWLYKHPEVGIIVTSQSAYEFIKNLYNSSFKNNVVLIPQFHCNHEREKRTRTEIKTAGFIGHRDNMKFPLDQLQKLLNDIDIQLYVKTEFNNIRKEICDYYKNIDIHITFRKFFSYRNTSPMMKNPLKIVNACSFGIPSIALPEACYKEMSDYYIKINSIEEMINQIKILKNDKNLYQSLSEKGITKAEEYHIENIADLYKNLL